MKLQVAALLATANLITTSAAQWFPSCAWSDCMAVWSAPGCTATAARTGWDCLCSNATAIAQINTCIATACTNVTDQEAIYGAVAQLCANDDVSLLATQEATFSATSGGSIWPTETGGGWGPGGRWNSGAWSSWISACSSAVGSMPSNWNGNGGSWGGGHSGYPWNGPYGTKASGVDCASWTTWTAGWGPYSSWTGLWSGCSSTTATPSPATVTTTVTTNGVASVITGTTFGVQAQAVSATAGSRNAASTTEIAQMGILGGAAAAVFAVMVAL